MGIGSGAVAVVSDNELSSIFNSGDTSIRRSLLVSSYLVTDFYPRVGTNRCVVCELSVEETIVRVILS